RLGTGVWMLPETMEGDFATPELVYTPIGVPGPGDANGDGRVDRLDAIALAAHWLKASGALWSDGDFNRDGRVDDLDASILAANWGITPPDDETSVPEPGTMALLTGLLATLGVGLLHRRRVSRLV
ncbi:MAG: PEP-CTERM sorting domain-containing protein, partial [Pirellulales bacterium]|nr:PEP-CTERM sorting domain-containing protein [Pirellulales bacterium]